MWVVRLHVGAWANSPKLPENGDRFLAAFIEEQGMGSPIRRLCAMRDNGFHRSGIDGICYEGNVGTFIPRFLNVNTTFCQV